MNIGQDAADEAEAELKAAEEAARQRDLLREVVRKGADIMGDSPLGQLCRAAIAECEK